MATKDKIVNLEDLKVSHDDLDGKVDDLKSDLSVVFDSETLLKANQPNQVYPFAITANTEYYIKNITEENQVVSIKTCTEDGTQVEDIVNSLPVGSSIFWTATQNAEYVRLYALGTNTKVIIGKNGDVLNNLSSVGDNVDPLRKEIGFDWIIGYIDKNGNEGTSPERVRSPFIPCSAGASITYIAECNHANICGISFYDANFAFISGEVNQGSALGDELICTSPNNTAYLRLSTQQSIKNISFFRFNDIKNNVLVRLAQRTENNRTIYVDGTNGDDTTGIGSVGRPYKTIGRALKDRVYDIAIAAGTYKESLTINYQSVHLRVNDSAYSATANARPKVVLDGENELLAGITSYYASEIVLDGIELKNFTGNGAWINYCKNLEIRNSDANNNALNGFRIDYSDGEICDSEAHHNGYDGFNINGYGDTKFVNCNGYSNGDDGISHHQGTTGVIIGGEWYNNAKGGVASPCYGSKVDLFDLYSHDNAYGIYSFSDSADTANNYRVWNCVVTNNSEYGLATRYNTPTLYGCKINNNTKGNTTAYGTTSVITL